MVFRGKQSKEHIKKRVQNRKKNKGFAQSEKTKEKIRETLKRKYKDGLLKPNKGVFKKGRILSKDAQRKRLKNLKRGKENPNWKGDKASYVAKHIWIRNNFGKAKKCENPQCNFKNPKRYEWANLSGKYLRNRKDYIQLCPSCHRKMDNKIRRGL